MEKEEGREQKTQASVSQPGGVMEIQKPGEDWPWCFRRDRRWVRMQIKAQSSCLTPVFFIEQETRQCTDSEVRGGGQGASG